MSDQRPETTSESGHELKVTFYPPLFLQRRMWILGILRAENVTKVLDVGCGEGQLLAVLCQPAPWLATPPSHILPPLSRSSSVSEVNPLSPTYNDKIPNLHPTLILGLDVSAVDLAFALENTAPPHVEEPENDKLTPLHVGMRWEPLDVKIWKGGLQVINEEFIDIECIISTEVIEHLSPDVLPAFAPTLLGVYHPQLFLLTTPSYTFNARFTPPDAAPSARRGYPDPTGRTDRIFRHEDHKFEWTKSEFEDWCHETAEEWGYSVHVSSIGQSVEVDEWGRDGELGGATSVAVFRRLHEPDREAKARSFLEKLSTRGEPHQLLTVNRHAVHPSSQKPHTLSEIANGVRSTMEEFRDAFMRVEELWFERNIAILCGGWIELLVQAVEESDFLALKIDGESENRERAKWVVELIGGVPNPREYWPAAGEKSTDYIPSDWIPREADAESSEGGWGDSTDVDGDISWNESWNGSGDEEIQGSAEWAHSSWAEQDDKYMRTGWNHIPEVIRTDFKTNKDNLEAIPDNSDSSTTGWDGGDESDDNTS